MQKLDEWLLTKVFEPIAWWIEYHTGYSNFRVSQVALLPVVVDTMVGAVEAFTIGDSTRLASLVVLLMACCGLFWLIEFIQKNFTGQGLNPLRNNYRFRILVIAMTILFLPKDDFSYRSILSVLSDISYFAMFYFVACNRMPPWYREKKDEKARERHFKLA